MAYVVISTETLLKKLIGYYAGNTMKMHTEYNSVQWNVTMSQNLYELVLIILILKLNKNIEGIKS